MGGTISVESKKDQGTTFTVTLPLQIDSDMRTDAPKNGEAARATVSGMHILLVEDNELNMEIASFLLEDSGAVITRAWNGLEAVELYEASPPGSFDAILMDIMMPVMDGYEATGCIRALPRSDAAAVPIIAMTANAFSDDRLRAREAGMDAHIAKPLSIQTAIDTVAGLASGKKADPE